MEFKDSNPIYLQIADHFCENILLEKWKAGDRIPSVREMAVSIEVNPNTVMRTYNYLQDKGIIFNRRGIGYFVSEEGFEKTMSLRREDFIDHELPKFFRVMNLLGFKLKDIQTSYEKYSQNQNSSKEGEQANG